MAAAASHEPAAILSHLQSADGSATFSHAGYTVTGAVNGPIEVQRRDELPEEAVVDVIVRPAAGVGGTRERHLEALLQSTLRQIILIGNFPRTLIQITLQVIVAPENEYVNTKVTQASTNLPILPALIQTSILALLSAAIPLTATLTSAALAVDENSAIIANPTAREIELSKSLHVFAYTSHDDLVLSESEGEFTFEEWSNAQEAARQQCCKLARSEDVDMDADARAGADLKEFTRSTVEAQIASDLHWK
ncbi:exosome non-catalytic core subunit rrp46 [Pestalotiopsis sp. 9143b]|nr:exosome non-catalytic core subunit rrp46 [Pestalotiopsis sp. 9143b]